MIEKLHIVPYENEQPSEYADRLGITYAKQVSLKHKKDNGQFFTPTPIAKLMASFCEYTKSSIRILDPGCGTAILSCALIEKIVERNSGIEIITLDVYETDSEIIPFTQESLNYLKAWLLSKEIKFQSVLHIHDFILDNASILNPNTELSLFETDNVISNLYDIIISNPPYFKLSKDDKRTIAAQKLVSGQPNIYSLFMGIAAKLLSDNGELIFITPRSFASGNYFKAFRDFFFNTVQLQRIHLFISRKETFDRDKVLQETVIIKAIREKIDPLKEVIVSSSAGIKDIYNPSINSFQANELISLHSKEIILHLPTSDKEENILNLISTWDSRLIDYDIYISTGPVVSFRAEDFIQSTYENGTVFLAPLFWLHNVNKMVLEWPKQFKEKGQYIRIEESSRSLLIPNKNYIFLRRFSTKDDKSRLIAAPYFCNYFESDLIGVENKVNYLYRKKGHLERSETVGLCALLNSELFDTYFRIFNGNVNVSATELREMRFPPVNELKEIGNKIILSNDYSVTNVNHIVNESFHLELSKIEEAQEILKALGLPSAQYNEMAALTLLAVCNIKEQDNWKDTTRQSVGVSNGIMNFVNEHYGKTYAPNTRETFRRQVLHQFVLARIVDYNPDNPKLPVNSPKAHYALTAEALEVIKSYKTKNWEKGLSYFLSVVGKLSDVYLKERELNQIPVILQNGETIKLSAGKHNEVQAAIVQQFAPRFANGGVLLYLGDTAKKDLFLDEQGLKDLGIPIDQHSKLPDVVILDTKRNWLFLIEAVTSHGPVSPKRLLELEDFLKDCKVGKVYVTAFPDMTEFKKHSNNIAWETEVWLMEVADHMIHFNGDRFMGPR